MIPLGDASRRPTTFPTVTLALIAANAIVFLLELANGEQFALHWSLVPAEIASGHRLETILTSMFMHAGWSHIIGNMVFLWAFGPEIEDEMGPGRYLIFYLLGGVAAALAQAGLDPHSTVPTLGASGAIAAVMGAFLVTFPQDKIRTILIIFVYVTIAYIPAVVLIGFWFLTQLWDAGTVVSTQTSGVAYTAHIAGMLFGMTFARLFERVESQ